MYSKYSGKGPPRNAGQFLAKILGYILLNAKMISIASGLSLDYGANVLHCSR